MRKPLQITSHPALALVNRPRITITMGDPHHHVFPGATLGNMRHVLLVLDEAQARPCLHVKHQQDDLRMHWGTSLGALHAIRLMFVPALANTA